MGLEKQGSKPTGIIGTFIGRLMNSLHTDFYVNYFQGQLPAENSVILDIGCGGGKFIQYLTQVNKSYEIFGIDHSQKMIALSYRLNQSAIENKKVTLIKASVTDIPIESNRIDLTTAFETIQFWPDIDKSLTEIIRLLKKCGIFLIINRVPSEGSKWWKISNLKSDEEYKKKLKKAGFDDINIDLDYKKGWIIVKATK